MARKRRYNIEMNTLLVSETYTTIQGGTTYIGRPCFIIRLATCNLNCNYCDKKYTLNMAEAKEYDVEEIVSMALSSGVSLVEITGGEPLLQKNTFLLTKKLLKNEFTVLLETNGSLPITDIPRGVIRIINCKCPSSGESEKMLFENFYILRKQDEVKFIMCEEEDYKFAVNIISSFKLLKRTQKIIFIPVTEKLPIKFLANWMIRDKIPVILQLQLQKVIWPEIERGV